MRSYHTIYIFIYGMDPFHKRTQDSSCACAYLVLWHLFMKIIMQDIDITNAF